MFDSLFSFWQCGPTQDKSSLHLTLFTIWLCEVCDVIRLLIFVLSSRLPDYLITWVCLMMSRINNVTLDMPTDSPVMGFSGKLVLFWLWHFGRQYIQLYVCSSSLLQLRQVVSTAICTLLGNFLVLLGNLKIQTIIWPWITPLTGKTTIYIQKSKTVFKYENQTRTGTFKHWGHKFLLCK